MNESAIGKAVIYLRIVFWGWVLHVVIGSVAWFPPYPTTGCDIYLLLDNGIRIDWFVVMLYVPGIIVTLVGLASLCLLRVNWRYSLLMLIGVVAYGASVMSLRLVKPLSLRSAVTSICQWQLYHRPLGLLIVLGVPAMVLTCLAMRSMSRQLGLDKSAVRWMRAGVYFLVMGLIVGAIGITISAAIGLYRQSWSGIFPEWFLFLVARLSAYGALAYFYWVTSRMKREALKASEEPESSAIIVEEANNE